jgi:uncharacterized protein YbjT (DUF2867 family)
MKKIKVLITGSTGMVGKGVLYECLESDFVEEVLVVNRQRLEISNPKLKEIIHHDFFNLNEIEPKFKGYDACFFCLGVSSIGMKEEKFSRLTFDLTINFAESFLKQNPDSVFNYVSGTKTDSSEKGKVMWARVKGRTENKILNMNFKDAYMFRPGYIQPLKGIKSKTKAYQAMYNVLKYFYPVFKALIPNQITNTTNVGKAMIYSAVFGDSLKYLENKDINRFAKELDEK